MGEAPDGRPVALVVFYRANLMAADIAPITSLMEALDRQGLAPLGVAVSSLKDAEIRPRLEALIATHRPAIILNTTAFSALRGDDTTVLDAADVPVLQAVLSGSVREAWQDSARGLSPADLAMNVVLPELDGRLLTRAISFKAEAPTDPRLEFASVRHEPDPDRIDYVARLAAAWVRLGRTARNDRRLALVLSDYPARGGRTGYAVGLDTAASAAEILQLLRTEGFNTGGRDWQAADIERLLQGNADQIEIPMPAYRAWLKELSPGLQRALAETWGAPAGDAFRLPVLRCGNVLVLLQPDRGAPGRSQAGLSRPQLPAEPCLPRALCLAARDREDRRPGPSRHARHPGMAARQGAGAVGRTAGPRRCWARCRWSIPSSSTIPARRCRPSGVWPPSPSAI